MERAAPSVHRHDVGGRQFRRAAGDAASLARALTVGESVGGLDIARVRAAANAQPNEAAAERLLEKRFEKNFTFSFVPLTFYRVLLGVRLKTQMSSSSTFVTPKVRDD